MGYRIFEGEKSKSKKQGVILIEGSKKSFVEGIFIHGKKVDLVVEGLKANMIVVDSCYFGLPESIPPSSGKSFRIFLGEPAEVGIL